MKLDEYFKTPMHFKKAGNPCPDRDKISVKTMQGSETKSRQGRNVEEIEVRDIPYLTALWGLSLLIFYRYQIPNGTV
jgi:hypothetical protein